MKTNIQTFLSVTALAFTLVFTGCKKDDDPSNTDKITEKNFKLTAATVDPAKSIGGTLVTNAYPQLEDCYKDNILRFAKNNTYTSDESALKCDPLDPQTTTGTWVWNTDETVLTTTDPDGTTSLNVLLNDGTTFKASFVEVDGGINYTYTLTYTKQ